MMELAERISRYLAKCEPAITNQHGHDRTFATACILSWGFGLSVEEAWPFMAGFNSRCIPPWSERDLKRKLIQALAHPSHRKPRGYLLGQSVDYTAPIRILPSLEPVWPKPDLTAIEQIVSTGPCLCDLWEQSKIRWEDSNSHAEEIVDVLFPGNPLLCVGKSNCEFATRRRDVWRGRLGDLPLMAPNPSLAVSGRTQEGHFSEHSKEATARRVYQVIEFDFRSQDKSGRETFWAPLINRWRGQAIEIVDACAALIFHLRERLPHLVCVCFSGGKSLHAWFRVFELTPAERKAFMRRAVLLGADRTTFARSQFVRIPDGRRNTGIRQTCFYFDPREAVQP